MCHCIHHLFGIPYNSWWMMPLQHPDGSSPTDGSVWVDILLVRVSGSQRANPALSLQKVEEIPSQFFEIPFLTRTRLTEAAKYGNQIYSLSITSATP